MPIHNHTSTLDRLDKQMIILPGEISVDDYEAKFGPVGIISGHTPSVEMVPGCRRPEGMPKKPLYTFNGGVPAELVRDMKGKLTDYFTAWAGADVADRCGPYYVSACHNGIYIFFARQDDKAKFLRDMEGAFAAMPGEEATNRAVALARVPIYKNPRIRDYYAGLNQVDAAIAEAAKPETPAPAMQNVSDVFGVAQAPEKMRVRVKAGSVVNSEIGLAGSDIAGYAPLAAAPV